ncbi:MAG: RNA polymerase sigma factor FliA [Gammaproteobacteria bacterium]|nr:RNA polymerase sigma factor FliA [Gammaproteobacteria bacterium]
MNTYSSVATRNEYSDSDLVMQHVDLVKRIAHHLAARLPATVDVNDLMQSGMVGLLEAAGNFDASRGASFETYAGIRIRGAMLDDIRKHDWTPRSVHHKYRQVTEAMNAVEGATGRAASAEEVANHMGISIDEYHKILADSACSRLFSFEETLEEPTLQRKPPSSDSPMPDQELYQSQFRAQLAESIDQLPERERLVLSLYYEQELNLKEIGAVLDVSESRVCQIHGQAVMRLRAASKRWS